MRVGCLRARRLHPFSGAKGPKRTPAKAGDQLRLLQMLEYGVERGGFMEERQQMYSRRGSRGMFRGAGVVGVVGVVGGQACGQRVKGKKYGVMEYGVWLMGYGVWMDQAASKDQMASMP